MWSRAEGGGPRRALRRAWAALGAVLLVAAFPMLLPPAWLGMGATTPEALAARLAAGDPGVLVVDVRTAMEFRHGHIRGAVSLPLHRLPFESGALDAARDRELVLICLTGHRSRLAGLWLRLRGFAHLTNLDGGMRAWRARGLGTV